MTVLQAFLRFALLQRHMVGSVLLPLKLGSVVNLFIAPYRPKEIRRSKHFLLC